MNDMTKPKSKSNNGAMLLTIQISEKDFRRLNFPSDNLDWEYFIQRIKTEIAREALANCKAIAIKTGLSKLSLEDINAEINGVRNAKARH